MAANPPRADSDNVLSITLTQNGAPVTTATVTVAVVDPTGATTLTTTGAPHVSNGLYQYTAAPAVWPNDGTYTLTWVAVAGGRTLTRVEPLVVSK